MTMITTQQDILSLAAEIENLDGPSREMDARIAVAVQSRNMANGEVIDEWFWNNFNKWRTDKEGRVYTVNKDGESGAWFNSIKFTESLDAAVSMVPDGSYLRNMSMTGVGAEGGESWKVTINSKNPRAIHNGNSQYLAQAIASAALRSIAT